MEIIIVTESITKNELVELVKKQFANLVKAVVDIDKEIMAIGGELHADEETVLIEQGSEQKNLWGINLHPTKGVSDWIEFDSMINVRPAQENYSRSVENAEIKDKIIAIVKKIVRS